MSKDYVRLVKREWDRFVKALRLQQINTLESANPYLEREY